LLRVARYLAAFLLELPVVVFAIWLWALRFPRWWGVPVVSLLAVVAWGAAYLVAGTLYMLRYGRRLRAAVAVSDFLRCMADPMSHDAG
jgi:hypothetical protein